MQWNDSNSLSSRTREDYLDILLLNYFIPALSLGSIALKYQERLSSDP